MTYEASVKICPDLRLPLPYEAAAACIHCPGQCVTSSVSKLLRLNDPMGFAGGADGDGRSRSSETREGPINVYKWVGIRGRVIKM